MSLEISPSFLLNFSESKMIGEYSPSYRFGSFRLDLEERQLLQNDLPVRLTPKAFDVLATLVIASGHLVKKEDLLRTVWADSFVEEANIARVIHTLRKVLGVHEGETFIETVAKTGYRFVAEVHKETVETKNFAEQQSAANLNISPFEISKSDVSHLIAAKPKMRFILFTLGFLTAVSLLLLASFNFQSWSSANSNKSIAVLPLKPINAGVRDELYEIGIADSLIHRLGEMKGFSVRPLNATRGYSDVDQDPIAAGKEQQSDYVLASNYQIADGRIRITAQLFDVASGQIEESYKSEKDVSDIFATQDAVAAEIGDLLRTRFGAAPRGKAAKRGTRSEEAYRLYLQGMYLYNNRNQEDLRKAVETLESAVQVDPNYALAWAGLAHARRSVGGFGRRTNTHDVYQKSIEAINKALALDPDLSEAYSALCENKFIYEWDFVGAESSCKRAIELNPDSTLAHQVYSRFLAIRGRADESLAEIKTAIDIEPASLFNQRLLGNSLQYARRYDEAISQFKRVIAMDEDFGTSYMWLSQTLALAGKESDAFEVWLQILEKVEADEETVRVYRTQFETSGWIGVMLERAKRFEEGNEIYFHGAAYNALVGDHDKAFELLERSYQRREWGIVFLRVDPRLDSLQSDPRLNDLARRIGLNDRTAAQE